MPEKAPSRRDQPRVETSLQGGACDDDLRSWALPFSTVRGVTFSLMLRAENSLAVVLSGPSSLKARVTVDAKRGHSANQRLSKERHAACIDCGSVISGPGRRMDKAGLLVEIWRTRLRMACRCFDKGLCAS